MANRKASKVKGRLAHGSGSVEGTALRALELGELVTTKDVDLRPTVHVLGLHHTIPDELFSHCAFTGKVMRFPAVLHAAGCRVVEYSNGSASRNWATCGHLRQDRLPDVHVPIFTEEQLTGFFGDRLYSETTTTNHQDSDVKAAFMALAIRAMKARVNPGDIVAHVFGPEQRLLDALPQAIHVETGIGYAHGPIGCYRIFESESWRAWHFGRYILANNGGGGTWPHYPEVAGTAVCPNYYDTEDWALGEGGGSKGKPYLLYVGRMSSCKGIEIVDAVARALPNITVAVITGEAYEQYKQERMAAPNILWVGRVSARAELARWYGGALATLMPSRFHEPFGGVAVESLLCGTPVIASDFAAFTETVQGGDGHSDGLRCMTTEDFIYAAKLIVDAHGGEHDEWNCPAYRTDRQKSAQARYGIEAIALRYKAAFQHFRRMWNAGIAQPGHPMQRPMPEGT